MATVKQVIGSNTGASSRATQYKKSARLSASFFDKRVKAPSKYKGSSDGSH